MSGERLASRWPGRKRIGDRMRRMILSAFFFNPQGDHRISWRHPKAPSREVFELPYFQSLPAIAEAAKLDALFVADHVGMWDTYESNVAHYANPRLEPMPELQRRGLAQTEYRGDTLRERLGLKKPPTSFTQVETRGAPPVQNSFSLCWQVLRIGSFVTPKWSVSRLRPAGIWT